MAVSLGINDNRLKVSLMLAERIRSIVLQSHGLGIWNRLIISEPESANMRTSG